MKKILLMAMLATLAINGVFAKGKKTKTEEAPLEVTANEFFSENFTAQKGILYKITGINLSIGLDDKIYFQGTQWDSLSQVLSNDEKSRIQRATDYETMSKNYIMYVQTNKSKSTLKDLKVIKIENIPTEDDFAKEDRLAEERKAEEVRLAAEREAEQKKKIEEMKAIVKKQGGYDIIPWGTTFEEFRDLYFDAKKEENEGSLVVYSRKGTVQDSEMFYKFFEDKLVCGVTVFSDISDQKSTDIATGLKQLYGEPSVSKDLSKHKTESVYGTKISYEDTHLLLIWNKSPTFKIQVDLTAKQLDDGYGIDFMTKAMLNEPTKITVTYSNEKKMATIKANDEKQKKAADAEVQNKRINNLGL